MAQGVYNIIPRSVAYDQSEEAVKKAIALDGSLAEAHASLGYVQKSRFRWQDAEASFRRAIALKPSYAEAHHWLSVLLTQRADFPQAVTEVKAAIALDPLSLPAKMQLGSALLMARQYDMARVQFQEVVRADPGIAVAYRAISVSYCHQGRYEDALRALEKASAQMSRVHEDGEHKSYLGYVLARAGRTSEALALRSELVERSARVNERLAGSIAAIDVGLGRPSEALDWLEKAAAMNDPDLNYLKVDPRWDPLRAEPRFVALQERLGFGR
jgi:tetratricopeptide (TPR) repeat protein